MNEVTRILKNIEQRHPSAAEELHPVVDNELRNVASAKLSKEKLSESLHPTMPAHEAYVRLVNTAEPAQWNGLGHFFAATSEAMRRMLAENARRRSRLELKCSRHCLEREAAISAEHFAPEILAPDDGPGRFEEKWSDEARLARLRDFVGL